MLCFEIHDVKQGKKFMMLNRVKIHDVKQGKKFMMLNRVKKTKGCSGQIVTRPLSGVKFYVLLHACV